MIDQIKTLEDIERGKVKLEKTESKGKQRSLVKQPINTAKMNILMKNL